MAQKRLYKCVVVALSAVLVASVLVIMMSPATRAAIWTQTSDTDFKKAVSLTNVEIVGTGDPAYLQLTKGIYNWNNKNPPSPPTGRYGLSMTYDTYNGRVFLFGGYDTTGKPLNDTWTYSLASNTWTLIETNAPPPARYLAGMAFDTTHNVAVLFGGYDVKSKQVNYTWEYNAATGVWTNRTSTINPTGLSVSSLTYDSTADKVILAGQGKSIWETWAYNVPTHVWTLRTGSNPPSSRGSFRLAYYPSISRTVLYGGGFGPTVYDETWEYNYASDSWTDVTGSVGGTSPGGRISYGFVGRPEKTDLMLWGGGGGSGSLTDVYLYSGSGSTRTWDVQTAMTSPPVRSEFGMVYEPSTKATIVFGGRTPGGVRLADTWAFEPGYVAEGWITSMLFDTLYATSQWKYVFWNQTPAAVPPSTEIRVQIATGNYPDPNATDPDTGGPAYEFHGPDGTPFSYFSSPGQAINSIDSPKRYAMYKANLLCFSCTNSPHLEDVSIIYNVPAGAPYITSKAPVTPPFFSVSTASPIWINFSEPMDTPTVQWDINPKDVTLTEYWYDSNTRLRLDHAAEFNICTQYKPKIVAAKDLDGNSIPGLPIEWFFVTTCPPPEVKETYPHHGDSIIPLAAPVYVNFTQPMDTGWLFVNFTPTLSVNPFQWSNNNKSLMITHANFQECQEYSVDVQGKSVNGIDLAPGAVPNPWQFWSLCLHPEVIWTDPTNGAFEVAVDYSVTIHFSHKMDTGTVSVVFNPAITLTKTWNSPLDTELVLSHPPNFAQGTLYKVNVTGRDTAGNDLKDGYYTWWFFTTWGGAPYVINTDPVHMAENVPVDNNITIHFSEPMVSTSVVYSVEPQWPHDTRWSPLGADMFLTNDTTPLDMCKTYYVNVTDGIDQDQGLHLKSGPVPQRFYFSTVCPYPFVADIIPADGEENVTNDTNIVVTFSKPMDTTTFQYELKPDPPLNKRWNTPSDTVFYLEHGPLFQDCTDYVLTLLVAADKGGNPLMGQRAFAFKTFCPPTNPYITYTDPEDQETGVPLNNLISVAFSRQMDTATLAVSVQPNVTLMPANWSPNGTYVQLDHAMFTEGTLYTVQVWACDLGGICLAAGPVPNPWHFTTMSANPQITYTSPRDTDVNVQLTAPIVIKFSKTMNKATVSVPVSPPGVTFTRDWTDQDKTLTMNHTTSPFSPATRYCVGQVFGKDTFGNDLVGGPVPNPWCFWTTVTPGATGGLQVRRQTDDILLTWKAAQFANGYNVYESQGRLAPWPWAVLANVTTTSYLHQNGNIDGLNHYYIVRAYNSTSWLEGANSTMGVKLHKVFTKFPAGPNTQWFSLPYRTIYKRASDIATELGSLNIDIVAKWDPVKQKSIIYSYFRGMWRGTNFAINPGDGLWLGVKQTFSWSINGTDYAQPLQFNLNGPPTTNYFWISLPYTNPYRDASALSTELGSARIWEIWHYNSLTNKFEVWQWNGLIWTGVNFAIMSGDGICLKIVSTFAWTPKLITPEVP